MSDYLNNLAARSTGRTDQFRPRLQSLFEPASGRTDSQSIPSYYLEDAGIDQVDHERLADHGERPSDAAARDRPTEDATVGQQGRRLTDEPDPFQQSRVRISPPSHKALQRTEPGLKAQRQHKEPPPEGEIKARPTAPGDASASSPAHPVKRHDVPANTRSQVATARDNRSAQTRQTPMPDHARNDRRQVDWGLQAKAAISVTEQSLDQRVDQGFDHARSPASRGYPGIEFETANKGSIEGGLPIGTYSEEARQGERRVVSPAPLGAQPASTIKITIGRVEVRAIVNESQSRRPESNKVKPRMTLEEYLKQRNGGQR